MISDKASVQEAAAGLVEDLLEQAGELRLQQQDEDDPLAILLLRAAGAILTLRGLHSSNDRDG